MICVICVICVNRADHLKLVKLANRVNLHIRVCVIHPRTSFAMFACFARFACFITTRHLKPRDSFQNDNWEISNQTWTVQMVELMEKLYQNGKLNGNYGSEVVHKLSRYVYTVGKNYKN